MPIYHDWHVWLWQAKLADLFAQFNPNVHCGRTWTTSTGPRQ
jgi:hypothetical protein